MRNETGLRRIEDAFKPLLLQEAFIEFTQSAAEFSKRASFLAGNSAEQVPSASARPIFSKWNFEILTLLNTQGTMRFQEIRKSLGMISTGVLSKKLNTLQERELVERSVLNSKPPASRYSLTEKGFTAVKLCEPLLLYLRFYEGLPSRRS